MPDKNQPPITAHRSMLESRLASLAAHHGVTGVALARIRNGAVESAAAGLRDAESGAAVDDQTVFDAASLSKPMVAYAVLQLADAAVLDIDQPLSRHVQPVVPQDPASALITARHLLTHTGGLENVRGKEPLRLYFQPGAWFSYSSVGFGHLQSAVEAQTGEPLEATMRRLVFEPLGMRRSSFEWQQRFAGNAARPHEDGKAMDKHLPRVAAASYSLQTTAGDYGLFVAAVLRGDRLREATWRQWLTTHVRVPRRSVLHLQSTPPETDPELGWGLGWGIESVRGTFFQWGKLTGVRAFVMGSVAAQSGLVVLTNSNAGLRLMEALTSDALPGEHPAIGWLHASVSE